MEYREGSLLQVSGLQNLHVMVKVTNRDVSNGIYIHSQSISRAKTQEFFFTEAVEQIYCCITNIGELCSVVQHSAIIRPAAHHIIILFKTRQVRHISSSKP